MKKLPCDAHPLTMVLAALAAVAASAAACESDPLGDGAPEEMQCDLCHGNPPDAPHPQSQECGLCHGETVGPDGRLARDGGSHLNGSVDVTASGCDVCHGYPPPLPHIQSEQCHKCHGDTVTADGDIDDAGNLHRNGKVDVAAGACDSCHGGAGNPAPPPDLGGNVKPDSPGVGAHQAHLADATWHKKIDCAACHKVPAAFGDPGHADTPGPAELNWGSLASSDGATPAYDFKKHSCSGIYCHGATLGGAVFAKPSWTSHNQGQSACGACHGVPPPPPHPESGECHTCHSQVIGPAMQWVAPDRHIDGILDAGY